MTEDLPITPALRDLLRAALRVTVLELSLEQFLDLKARYQAEDAQRGLIYGIYKDIHFHDTS